MKYVSPASLISLNRLDVFLKKLYFDVISGRRIEDSGLIKNLYRKHIFLRTGGIEPPDLYSEQHFTEKISIGDYEAQAQDLYKSIEAKGFNQQKAIAVSDDLLLMNGAHRLAAAVSLGLDAIPIERSAGGGLWGTEWFKYNLKAHEYLFLLSEYALFKRDTAPIILWGIAEASWDSMIEELKLAHQLRVALVQILDLRGNFDGFHGLIHDVYDVSHQTNDNIRRKALIHGCYSTKIAVLLVEPVVVPSTELEFYSDISRIKVEIRNRFNAFVDRDVYLTLHAPDRASEKKRMVDILFSDCNVRFLRAFRRNEISTSFRALLERFKSALASAGVPFEEVCIVGGAVLGALGIRRPGDIDFVASRSFNTGSLRALLNRSGEFDLLLHGYTLSMGARILTSEDLIRSSRCHFIVNGLKIADPRVVYFKKKLSSRRQDQEDLLLIRDRYREHYDDAADFLRNELLWLEKCFRDLRL
jgi:hypothetical protein